MYLSFHMFFESPLKTSNTHTSLEAVAKNIGFQM